MNVKKLLLLLVCSLQAALAQPDGDFIFALGTVAQDEAERDWGWISLASTRPELLLNRQVAVLRKQGGPDAPGTFELESVMGLQTDPRVVEMLIGRAARIGGDPDELEADLASLFQDIQLDASLSRSEKLLAVLLGSLDNPAAMENLIWLAGKHPALAMTLGLGHATLIPGKHDYTFELREWDNGAIGEVLGRVVLTPGEPRVLPAPIGLVEIPDNTPGGHLNVHLGWEPGPDLRRLSLLQFGYNVYRAEAEFAEGKEIHENPTLEQILFWMDQNVPEVIQVNQLPVMINEMLPPGEAVFVDDNRRFDLLGEAFADGDRYYYYVAARDLLGRPGELSTPVEVTLCDRMPPLAPSRVTVHQVREADPVTGVTHESLRVTWRQVTEFSGGPPMAYSIYRDSGDGPVQVAADIPHLDTDPPTTTRSWLDETVDQNDFNTHYVYTVRTAKLGACGPLYSRHGGPAFGHITDWSSPPAPEGTIQIRCPVVGLENLPVDTEDLPDPLPFMTRARVVRPVYSRLAEWAEIRWSLGTHSEAQGPDNYVSGSMAFFGDEKNLSFDLDVPANTQITVYARVGQPAGPAGDWIWQEVTTPEEPGGKMFLIPNTLLTVGFMVVEEFLWGEPGTNCSNHVPPHPDDPPPGEGQPAFNWPVISLNNIPEGHEWRLYREVNGGPRTLMSSGTRGVEVIEDIIDDVAGAPTCSRICYFVQQVTPDGMPSPMRRLGCYSTERRLPPVPELSRPRAGGTAEVPEMILHWYAPPYGINHFTVALGSETFLPEEISPELTPRRFHEESYMLFTVDGVQRSLFVGQYETRAVGNGFGEPGEADFTLSLPVDPNRTYVVTVRAVGDCGSSEFSLSDTFIWSPPDTGPEVPWPARPLPDVVSGAIPQLQAELLPEGVGIRLGRLPYVAPEGEGHPAFGGQAPFVLYGFSGNPMEFLFTDRNEKNIFPFLLYRVQIASESLPVTSGSAVQVSPLMENIAYQVNGPDVIIRDPFYNVIPDNGNPNANFGHLYVLDTQPVLAGARYQYFVLQLDDRYEPWRVIPLNPVEIPE